MKIYNKVSFIIGLLFLVVMFFNRGKSHREEKVDVISWDREVEQPLKKNNSKKKNSGRGIASETVAVNANSSDGQPSNFVPNFSTNLATYRSWDEMKLVFGVIDRPYMKVNDTNYYLSRAKVVASGDFEASMGKRLSEKKGYVIYRDTTSDESSASIGKVLINEVTMQVALFFNDGFIQVQNVEEMERLKNDLKAMQIKSEYGGSDTIVQIFLTEDMNWRKLESTLYGLPGVTKVYPRFLISSIETM